MTWFKAEVKRKGELRSRSDNNLSQKTFVFVELT